MRGEVEIWRNDELLLKEPNMLVDGAGELLADIMTVSPSLSGVEDHATSSILDASNYRLSFQILLMVHGVIMLSQSLFLDYQQTVLLTQTIPLILDFPYPQHQF
jgi:hypothetical protein